MHGRKGDERNPPYKMPPLGAPFPQLKLNLAGVAGFFGGEEAISAMTTIHLYKGTRWLGWYNAPGSGAMAKEFGRMVKSHFWDALFPGSSDTPTVVFGLDGKKGPKYIAALSGTTLQTGHLGYLTMELSKRKEVETKEIKGKRQTTPVDVAYLAMKNVDRKPPVENVDPKFPVKLLTLKTPLLGALIPITVSVVTCVMCALLYIWFCFSIILAGMITSGFASAVIGEGRLFIRSAEQPPGAPPGHGILMGDSEDRVVVIKGAEQDVNVITKGRFDLAMPGDDHEGRYHAIGPCSFLLLVPVLLQPLLIPQGTSFGQLLFLISLGVSSMYNFYISSLREKTRKDILFEALGHPQMLRFRADTWTIMGVFVCLLLFHGVERSFSIKDHDLRIKILDACLPDNTVVWSRWKEKVVEQHLNIDGRTVKDKLPWLAENEEDQKLSEKERAFLRLLLDDADAAFRAYLDYRGDLPVDSSHQKIE